MSHFSYCFRLWNLSLEVRSVWSTLTLKSIILLLYLFIRLLFFCLLLHLLFVFFIVVFSSSPSSSSSYSFSSSSSFSSFSSSPLSPFSSVYSGVKGGFYIWGCHFLYIVFRSSKPISRNNFHSDFLLLCCFTDFYYYSCNTIIFIKLPYQFNCFKHIWNSTKN